MLKKILIANRGEIACRIIRTLKKLHISSVAVYSETDENAPHVAEADEAYLLGPAAVGESYLNQKRLLEIIQETKADGIHPGYGLLSENADFADACEKVSIAWIGPTPEQMRLFGLKHTARQIAQEANVPLLSGTELIESLDEAVSAAQEIGFPVMLKSTAGGGGIGMKVCNNEEELRDTFQAVRHLSQANFGQSGVFLVKFIARARHIEVQIFGDGKGKVLALGERDCSTQRRNQKVLEESPAPNLAETTRQELFASAVRLGEQINYRSAGTVEYLYDPTEEKFYFLEVNTRLQVEHPVTESCLGIDLVEWMVQLGSGKTDFQQQAQSSGHSIEARIYAEDPHENFQPSSGLLTHVDFPKDVRIDHWISPGANVSSFYDPMLAKVIVHADNRKEALTKLSKALASTTIAGIETNLEYLRQIVADDVFGMGQMTTRSLDDFDYQPNSVSVLSGGMQTTIQGFPGRLHYWNVGIPPSGPMDALSFQLANEIVGNSKEAAGIEITELGPCLRFNHSATIALTGATFPATIDGKEIPFHQAIAVPAGSILKLGNTKGPGSRAYLAVKNGFDVPDYLGSKSTFTLGQFGGHGGRALQVGDVLHISSNATAKTISQNLDVPELTNTWDIGVLYGPHGAPDFFTEKDIETFFETEWEVHYNSARTGVRLIGPKPQWARPDGGEAGLHPSNIHDNAYAIGAIDFTGDMPVILGPDGPSLGGFVCPAVIAEAELWKMGQLRPGDKVRFLSLTNEQAKQLYDNQQSALAENATPLLKVVELTQASCPQFEEAILYQDNNVCIRRAGDSYILIEYGELVLDLELRFKVHLVYQWLLENQINGIIDITPGIRSLQLHFDQSLTQASDLIEHILKAESEVQNLGDTDIPARTVYLPLSWDDPSTQIAIDKYMKSVYPEAPWCPSNIEFIRRINGLDSIEDVYNTVFDATYLVMGLGDVYLGAPVATPLDPRHRLVTTKYNPARTWTPENAVGIGGAYLCVYGMEGPGGYQFVGRTVQMWNRYKTTADFKDGKPWLLRFFDHIKFYPVSEEELSQHRKDFIEGRFKLRIEETTFNLKKYKEFLEIENDSISTFRTMQQKAFQEERQRWHEAGLNVETPIEVEDEENEALQTPDNCINIESPINGNVWKILVKEGQHVETDEVIAILEAMKMEINVTAPEAGTIENILISESSLVKPGQALLWLKPNQ